VHVEDITDVGVFEGNTPAIWGYHQSLIVRTGDSVFAAIMEPRGDGFQQQWSLFERTAEGAWLRRYTSLREEQINQPPTLLADDGDGRLHVVAWPEGEMHHYQFDPGSGSFDPVVTTPERSPHEDLYPYSSSALNEAGDILSVVSPYRANRFALRSATTEAWTLGLVVAHEKRPESPSQWARQAYPFVELNGREAHVFTTQDINDQEKIDAAQGFTYSFRTLQYHYSPDVLNEPFTTTEIVNVEESKGWAHNDDMLLDSSGRIHLIYQFQLVEGDWGATQMMHAFGPGGGPLKHVPVGDPGQFNEGRLWESPEGGLFIVLPRFQDLHVAALTAGGELAEEPAPLNITSSGWGYSGRVFLVSPNGGGTPGRVLEGLFSQELEDGRVALRYFQASRGAETVIAETGTVPQQVALGSGYPNPFNGSVTIPYSVRGEGRVRLEVVNMAGQRVVTLADDMHAPGSYARQWDGADDRGERVASGAYLIRLTAGQVQFQDKLMYLK